MYMQTSDIHTLACTSLRFTNALKTERGDCAAMTLLTSLNFTL